MTAYKLHDVESLIDWFMELDKNNDEKVDRNELMAAYQKHNIPAEKIDVSWKYSIPAPVYGRIRILWSTKKIEFCHFLSN